jgi:hypothetical protein
MRLELQKAKEKVHAMKQLDHLNFDFHLFIISIYYLRELFQNAQMDDHLRRMF